MLIQAPTTPGDRRRRRALQMLFIFANLVLVEVHVPGLPWVIVGAVFWLSMVLLAVVGGSWMCGWVCWIGGVQDLMEPLARTRIKINPRWGQAITLALLIAWVPLFWWLFPEASNAIYTPFNVSLEHWPRHVFQLGLMLLAGLSVTFLGKRGICRVLCPFNAVVNLARRWWPKARSRSTTRATSCQGCGAACQHKAIQSSFTPDLSIPLAGDTNWLQVHSDDHKEIKS